MIFGEEQDGDALDLIRAYSILFTLTGSRFFGTDTPLSDWDFFTDYTPETVKWLDANGFKKEMVSYREDPVIVTVYLRDYVHVQLVQDSRIKRLAQGMLNPYFREYKPTKEQAKKLWSLALKMYRYGSQ